MHSSRVRPCAQEPHSGPSACVTSLFASLNDAAIAHVPVLYTGLTMYHCHCVAHHPFFAAAAAAALQPVDPLVAVASAFVRAVQPPGGAPLLALHRRVYQGHTRVFAVDEIAATARTAAAAHRAGAVVLATDGLDEAGDAQLRAHLSPTPVRSVAAWLAEQPAEALGAELRSSYYALALLDWSVDLSRAAGCVLCVHLRGLVLAGTCACWRICSSATRTAASPPTSRCSAAQRAPPTPAGRCP